MLIYMYSVEIQVYRVHVRRLAIMKNHWGTTGMPEIILIHTCTLCILSFSSQKRKGKEDKLPDILSNKEGPFVHLVKGNDCSRFKAT